MYNIGKNLVKVREDLNITQQEMADRVGISRVTLYGLEKEKIHIFNESFLRFAEVNKIPLEELILGYKPEVNGHALEQARAEYGMERDALIADYEDKISALNAKIEDLTRQITDLRDHLETKNEIIAHLRSQIPSEQ